MGSLQQKSLEHTKEYELVIRNKVQKHATLVVNVKIIRLNESSQGLIYVSEFCLRDLKHSDERIYNGLDWMCGQFRFGKFQECLQMNREFWRKAAIKGSQSLNQRRSSRLEAI